MKERYGGTFLLEIQFTWGTPVSSIAGNFHFALFRDSMAQNLEVDIRFANRVPSVSSTSVDRKYCLPFLGSEQGGMLKLLATKRLYNRE